MAKKLNRIEQIKKAVAVSNTLRDTENYNKIIATLECIKFNGNLDKADTFLMDSAIQALIGMTPGRLKTEQELKAS